MGGERDEGFKGGLGSKGEMRDLKGGRRMGICIEDEDGMLKFFVCMSKFVFILLEKHFLAHFLAELLKIFSKNVQCKDKQEHDTSLRKFCLV